MDRPISNKLTFPYEYSLVSTCRNSVVTETTEEPKMEKQNIYDIGSTLDLLKPVGGTTITASPSPSFEIVIDTLTHTSGLSISRDEVETLAVSEVISAVKTGDYEYLDTVAGNFDQYVNRVMVTTFTSKVGSVSTTDLAFQDQETI